MSTEIDCDLLVVGAGINGAGIARDAAGRGMSVLLCDKDDLGSHTSSASTKLIHGGLRYLEHGEFALVRKALIEREILLRAAPHIMRPLRFVMPHDKGQRPAWMIRAGLFLYDHLARRELLPASQRIDLRRHEAGAPLKTNFTLGFAYSDGWVDDARLVVLNAVDAAEKGATILTRTQCVSALRQDGRWLASLSSTNGTDGTNGTNGTNGATIISVNARCMVNATGPWAAHFLQTAAHQLAGKPVRLVKGSHIVVRSMFSHPHAYIFQHPDRRIIFAIPYEQDFTLIGTTDVDYQGNADRVSIDQDEIAYLCALSNRYFKQAITAADVLWSYSGVRPLLQDESTKASALTRDYRLEFDTDTDGAPLLSVFGGKITTFRKLAEQAVDLIAARLSNKHGAWTANACLPGGDICGPQPSNRSVLEFEHFVSGLQRQYGWLPPALVARYARAYGTRIHALLADRHQIAEMGQEIASGLFGAEVVYWIRQEWARDAADMLWRRSKLGLHLPAGSDAVLDAWIASRGLAQNGEATRL